MPYSYCSPDDMPLAPPRNATIPAIWDEIKHGGRKAVKPKPAGQEPVTEADVKQKLGLLIAHISHRLTNIPGGIDALRLAVQTVAPILFPTIPVPAGSSIEYQTPP